MRKIDGELERARDTERYVTDRIARSSELNFADRLRTRKYQLIILSALVSGHFVYLLSLNRPSPIESVSWVVLEEAFFVLICSISRISVLDYLLIAVTKISKFPYFKFLVLAWGGMLMAAVVAALFNVSRLPLVLIGVAAITGTVVFLFEPSYRWARFLYRIPRETRLDSARSLTFFVPLPLGASLLATIAIYLFLPYGLEPRWALLPFWASGPPYPKSEFGNLFYLLAIALIIANYVIFVDIPYYLVTKQELQRTVRDIGKRRTTLLDESQTNPTDLATATELLRADIRIRELRETPLHPFNGLNFILVQIALAVVATYVAQYFQRFPWP